MKAFHAKHFPGTCLPSQFFISSGDEHAFEYEEEYYDEDYEEDDGLGYYRDGNKRTLTDTQISIFRHGEIQRLLWREAGEYSGPIFPFAKEDKYHGKPNKGLPTLRTAKYLDRETNSKDLDDASKDSEPAKAHKKPHTEAKAKDDVDLEKDEGELSEGAGDIDVKSPATTASGTNRMQPTAKKNRRKLNKKAAARKQARNKERAFKSKEENAASAAKKRRRNSSSIEPDQRPQLATKKRRNSSSLEPEGRPVSKVPKKQEALKREETPDLSTRAGAIAAGLEERHDPEDYKEKDDGFTYRRMARDADDVRDVAIELDY